MHQEKEGTKVAEYPLPVAFEIPSAVRKHIRTRLAFNNVQQSKYCWMLIIDGKRSSNARVVDCSACLSSSSLSSSSSAVKITTNLATLVSPTSANLMALDFAPDDSFALLGCFGKDKNVSIYLTPVGEKKEFNKNNKKKGSSAAWERFKSFTIKGNSTIWDARAVLVAPAATQEEKQPPLSEYRVVIGSYNGRFDIFDPINQEENAAPVFSCKTGECVFGVNVFHSPITNSSFAVAGDSGKPHLTLWAVESGEQLADFPDCTARQNCCAISSSYIAAGNDLQEGIVSIYKFDPAEFSNSSSTRNMKKYKQLANIGGLKVVSEVCFSRGEEHLYVAAEGFFVFDSSGKNASFDLLWKVASSGCGGVSVSACDRFFATIDETTMKIYPSLSVERRVQARIRTVFRIQHFGKGRMGQLFASEYLPVMLCCRFYY